MDVFQPKQAAHQQRTFQSKGKTRGVHCGIGIYIKKYLKANEEIWKLAYFTMQKQNLQKNPPKGNQNPSRSYNSITYLKFPTQAKILSFKNPHIKIDLLLLPRGQNPLSYYTLIMNLNTISLPWQARPTNQDE